MAWRLAAHPDVEQVSYREPTQSVIVLFNRRRTFADLVATLPAGDLSVPAPVSPAPRVDWSRVAASCLLSLLPLGPFGSVALTFATSLTEEVRRAQATAVLPAAAPRS